MSQAQRKNTNTKLLCQIYKQQPLVLTQQCSNKLAKYTQDITKWEDKITEQQFINYLNGKISSSLAKIMFQMIYSTQMCAQNNDKNTPKIRTVTKTDIMQFVSTNNQIIANNEISDNKVEKIEEPKSKKITKNDKNEEPKSKKITKNDKNEKDLKTSLHNEVFSVAFSMPLVKEFMQWIKIKNV